VRFITGQLIQLRRFAGEQRKIRLGDTVAKRHLRPAVGYDVMGFYKYAAVALAVLEYSKIIQRVVYKRYALVRERGFPARDARCV